MTSVSKASALITGENRRFSVKALFALVFYLIIPIFAITTIAATYPELSRERLFSILYRTVPMACILILVSQFQVRYGKGSPGRFIMNEIYVILVLVWLYAFLGGKPVIEQTWEEYSFSLHIWRYLIVILVITFINVIYYIAEFAAYNGCLTDKDEPGNEREKDGDTLPTPSGVVITTMQVH